MTTTCRVYVLTAPQLAGQSTLLNQILLSSLGLYLAVLESTKLTMCISVEFELATTRTTVGVFNIQCLLGGGRGRGGGAHVQNQLKRIGKALGLVQEWIPEKCYRIFP